MEEQQDLNELARAFRHALKSRNISVNGAAQRYDISREALTKMWNGRSTTVEIAERFARAIAEDVNRWRELNGYPPVLNERPQDYFWRRFGMLADRAESLGAELELPRFHGGSAEALPTREQADAALAAIVRGIAEDYPEHAAAFTAWLEGEG